MEQQPRDCSKMVVSVRKHLTNTDQAYSTSCKCCDTYCMWKSTHIQQTKFLADAPTLGQSSPLNRRLYRTDKRKHPRSDQERATKRGVNHKKEHLKSALVVRKEGKRKKAEKISGLIEANKKLFFIEVGTATHLLFKL